MAKPFMSGYKTYDPAREGYGSPRKWRAAFRFTMGEAVEALRGTEPHEVLGLPRPTTWAELRSAYRRLSLKWHPDRVSFNPGVSVERATEMFKRISAAYTLLEERYRP